MISFAIDINAASIQSVDAIEEKFAGEEPVKNTIDRKKVEYDAENLTDPFQSCIPETEGSESQAGEPEVPLPSLTIQGLIWGGNFPQAIVNNKVVKIGDAVEGAEITSIDKGGITVSFGGKSHTISTPSANVNSNSTNIPGGG